MVQYIGSSFLIMGNNDSSEDSSRISRSEFLTRSKSICTDSNRIFFQSSLQRPCGGFRIREYRLDLRHPMVKRYFDRHPISYSDWRWWTATYREDIWCFHFYVKPTLQGDAHAALRSSRQSRYSSLNSVLLRAVRDLIGGWGDCS